MNLHDLTWLQSSPRDQIFLPQPQLTEFLHPGPCLSSGTETDWPVRRAQFQRIHARAGGILVTNSQARDGLKLQCNGWTRTVEEPEEGARSAELWNFEGFGGSGVDEETSFGIGLK